ncbi:hypothetical protein BDR05DRAFT_998892 [Suillus weaverae]|nr:hypothetical protein BDR05DRAFT_998892 [Suillus weaverae]
MTDGVTYEDVIPVLQEMLQSGAEADAKDVAGYGQSSDASIQIDTDITSIASQHESFFSLAPANNAITTKEPHEIAFPLKSLDEMWYMPLEKFKITSVLTAVAATSEVPKGDVQPLSHHDLPHHNIISQRSCACAALTSTTTNNLLTNVSTLMQGIIDNNDNDCISPIAVPSPSTVIPGPSHVVSNPKHKGSSTQDDTKLTKKSHTSERSKKTSHLVGPKDDGDYVPPGMQGKGKSRT